jgi:hypothetical protein
LTATAKRPWAVEQLERAYQPDQRVHVHGLHCALVVQGNVRKPDGTIYINTEEDDIWLGDAIKSARWLGLLDFERINDRRNNEPVIYRNRSPTGIPFRQPHAGASWEGRWTFELGELQVVPPIPLLGNFYRDQPYALVIFCERASGADVLRPIAERYQANLYVGAGETSNTHIFGMAKDGVEDGRPLVVLTVADFDPAGRQMPVSIGRKLQALRDLCFPTLQFKVVPVAMTPEQVREFGLPSTPLKKKEKRADKWLAEFGLAQTELDALATARPDILRQVVEQGIEPYYDRTLAERIARAKGEWRGRAQRVIDAHVDAEEVEGIRRDLDDLAADATRRIQAIGAEISERVSEADERLRVMVSGIRLPPIPTLPEAVLPTGETHGLLVSSEWSWIEQTLALKARKTYGEGD